MSAATFAAPVVAWHGADDPATPLVVLLHGRGSSERDIIGLAGHLAPGRRTPPSAPRSPRAVGTRGSPTAGSAARSPSPWPRRWPGSAPGSTRSRPPAVRWCWPVSAAELPSRAASCWTTRPGSPVPRSSTGPFLRRRRPHRHRSARRPAGLRRPGRPGPGDPVRAARPDLELPADRLRCGAVRPARPRRARDHGPRPSASSAPGSPSASPTSRGTVSRASACRERGVADPARRPASRSARARDPPSAGPSRSSRSPTTPRTTSRRRCSPGCRPSGSSRARRGSRSRAPAPCWPPTRPVRRRRSSSRRPRSSPTCTRRTTARCTSSCPSTSPPTRWRRAGPRCTCSPGSGSPGLRAGLRPAHRGGGRRRGGHRRGQSPVRAGRLRGRGRPPDGRRRARRSCNAVFSTLPTGSATCAATRTPPQRPPPPARCADRLVRLVAMTTGTSGGTPCAAGCTAPCGRSSRATTATRPPRSGGGRSSRPRSS